MANQRRKALGATLKRDLLIESGYKCANPTCRMILSVSILEDHHIIQVSHGGGDTFANLIALCPYCHTLFHKVVR
jgi:5-methylcytosine-specific restriction endonuclease McrA